MRLDFNVLWTDDQPALIAAQATALKRLMAEEGFELKATFCIGIEEVSSHLAVDVFRDEIDLILVDWDLGADLKGQTVITRIRETVAYKDIVFYSANADVADLRKVSFAEGHEGIYFVTRNQLVEEVNQLFHSMIKKVLDLDHTRGIVMGATSDVDEMARECLQLAHDMLDEPGRAAVLKEMVGLLDEKVPGVTKSVDKLKASPAVKAILAEHRTFTANDGLRILKRLLESEAFKTHEDRAACVTNYIQNVVPKRNILGHRVLSPEGKPLGIAGEAGETISVEDMRALRKLLLDLRHQFRDLHGALKTPA